MLAKPRINLKEHLSHSPLQKLHSPFLETANVQLYVKRDDLLHPEFGGNKWRKLKYNLINARQNNFDTLLTFGGAWSNHIYATAAAGKYFGFNTIGFIRGEQHTPLNATLAFASGCGMQLHYIDRKQYREKDQPEFIDTIKQQLGKQIPGKQQFGKIYILPEGGSNALAVKGCGEIIQEISSELDTAFDVICCASGTGATLAGLIKSIETKPAADKIEAIGFSALKGGEFLNDNIKSFLKGENTRVKWRIETEYHFGGYAKINPDLVSFMKGFESQFGIKLDAVYTGKMFYGLFKLIENRRFKSGSTIVAIHSGGLQGNKGFNL